MKITSLPPAFPAGGGTSGSKGSSPGRARRCWPGVRLALGPLLATVGGAAAQAVREAGAARVELDGPPPPARDAMINQAGPDGATLRAVRVAEPIQIDGVLDESLYASVPPIRELVQGVPVEYGEPSELTEVWIAFDDENVYVAARLWDSE